MKKKYSINFQRSTSPITEPVTKFGGQPVWITEPQWPISREAKVPMIFICQIVLEPALFGTIQGKMAYIFMTSDEYGTDTYDPDAGENAVIIQPNGVCDVETKTLVEGPTLLAWVENAGAGSYQPVELAVNLQPGEDPEFITDEDLWSMDNKNREEYEDTVSGDKIGGTPGFLQGAQFPDDGNWNLLLQLGVDEKYFCINFGDAGIGYAFISEDGTRGKFLWQCA